MMHIENIQLPAADDFPLAATVFSNPTVAEVRRIVLIFPALGVRRGYYAPFAYYLAERGLTALTLDYRGIGGSRPRHLRGFEAAMQDWGEKDVQGAIRWAGGRFPGARLLVTGHSAGGQLLGLAPDNQRVCALLAIASPSGYVGLYRQPHRLLVAAFMYLLLPVLARGFSYFPGKRLGLGEDLPKGVALQWAYWCRHPDYMVDVRGRPMRQHFKDFSSPILAYSFSDDGLAPFRNVEHLLTFYEQAPKRHRHIRPADIGTTRVGHMGFFRERFQETLWKDAADWLLEQ